MPEEIKKCNPCQFYGFFISVEDLFPEVEHTVDIDHEDITNQKLLNDSAIIATNKG